MDEYFQNIELSKIKACEIDDWMIIEKILVKK